MPEKIKSFHKLTKEEQEQLEKEWDNRAKEDKELDKIARTSTGPDDFAHKMHKYLQKKSEENETKKKTTAVKKK